jgi:hypothetical protein
VLFISEDPTADAPHERPVPAQQGLEGVRVLPAGVALQQVGVGQAVVSRQAGQFVNVTENRGEVHVGHSRGPPVN